MQYVEVAPIKLVRKDAAWFTYASEQPVSVGTIVSIPVGKQTITGVVLREVAKPAFECKPITGVIEETPLPAPLLATARWIADYYQTHLSAVRNPTHRHYQKSPGA